MSEDDSKHRRRGTLNWLQRYPAWAVLALSFAVYIGLTYLFWQHLSKTANDYQDQILRADVAKDFVQEIRRQSEAAPSEPSLAFNRAGKIFLERYPEIAPYILDEAGGIVLDLSAETRSAVDAVPLGPIFEWQKDRVLSRGPIYGKDPARPDVQVIFSAEPFAIGEFKGYAYVILQNKHFRLLHIPFLERGHWRGSFTFAAAGLAGLFIIALFVRHILSRLLGRIGRIVKDAVPDLPSAHLSDAASAGSESYESGILNIVAALANDRNALKGREEETKQIISRVSHDLRTPLLLIQDYAERLLTAEAQLGANEQRKEAERIRRNVKSLVSLLAEFNEFDRMKEGNIKLNAELYYMDELARDLVSIYANQAEDAGVSLKVEAEEELPPVRIDVPLVERALRNLLENAIRHTAAGGKVVLQLRPAGNASLRIAVIDSGCGIPAAELAHIFEPFRQVIRKDGQNGNSGLGLAIVEQVVQAHGSMVFVESRENAGTTFWFELPADDAQSHS